MPPAVPADVVAADNGFGFRLLRQVQTNHPGANAVLSPVSAVLNLSMVLGGAEGETNEEMLSALSLTGHTSDEIDQANSRLIKLMHSSAEGTILSVADSMWVDDRHVNLRPEFAKRTRAAYDAEVIELDLSSPGAPTQINGWASKQTQGKILKVIDDIGPADRLLLLDAVYFKGEWTHKFDKEQTQPRDFTRATGSLVQVPRMVQSGRFEYLQTPDFQAVRLPFGRGDLVMEVILPARASSLTSLEAQLTADHWASWDAQHALRSGTIELPRFELKSNLRLNEPLQALGMKRAFTQSAQFSGLFAPAPGRSNGGGFFISFVRQSTFWKVDEEGSEAAAVTSTGIRAAAVARPQEPFEMVVDRPFFCAIVDRRSGALLFIGAIYDPTA